MEDAFARVVADVAFDPAIRKRAIHTQYTAAD